MSRTSQRGQFFLVNIVQLGKGALVNVEVRQMWQEIISNEKSEENPVVDYALEIILERQSLPKEAEERITTDW